MRGYRNKRPGVHLALGLGVSALIAGGDVWAVTLDYGLAYSGVYSDNINRSRTGGDEEFFNVFRALSALREDTETVQAQLYSQIELRRYTQGNYDNDVLLAFDGTARYVMVPRRLTWFVQDRFTQLPIDPTFVLTPRNRQNTNSFTFGPDLTLAVSPVNAFEFGARYNNTYYEVSNTTNDRLGLQARFMHAVSPITQLSANYEPTRVVYDQRSLNYDYTRQDAFGRLRTRSLGNDIVFDLGQSFIQRENLRDVKGSLVRGTFNRRVNSITTMDINGSSQYSDAGRDVALIDPLAEGPTVVPVNPAEFAATGLYSNTSVVGNYRVQRSYGVNRFNLYWREMDFESVPLDQRLAGGFLDVGYDWSAAIGASVLANYTNRQYLNVPRNDVDYGAGLRFLYRFTRNFFVMVEGRYSTRDSTLSVQNYEERRLVGTVMYNTNYGTTVTNPFLQQNNPLYR